VAFPIVLANGPPADRLQEVADAGVTMVRTGIANWSGWNWSFCEQALRPVVQQLSSGSLAPALTALASRAKVVSASKDIELVTRQTDRFLYVLAVRRGGGTSQVRFSGLPQSIKGGQVLFEYVQDPPPLIVPTNQNSVRWRSPTEHSAIGSRRTTCTSTASASERRAASGR
jgi:hypothetical protein